MKILRIKKYLQNHFYRITFLAVFFTGLFTRFYLAINLPIWHDEMYTVWMTKFSLIEILSGYRDPVHPPGYYLFVKFLTIFSDHLFFLRTVHILFFFFNVLLLINITNYGKNKLSKIIIATFYILSGYFIIFDWQIRMYTGTLFLILLSWLFFLKKKHGLFLLIGSFGLIFDYAFFWFFFVFSLYYLVKIVFFEKNKFKKIIFLIISWLPFCLWINQARELIPKGINGISWMKDYLELRYIIGYLLGSHGNIIGLLFFLFLFVLGIFRTIKTRNVTVSFFAAGSFFIVLITYIYSIISSRPIFHLRSLQIVGIAIILLYTNGLQLFPLHKYKLFFIMIILIIGLNFFFVVNLIINQPGKILVSFYPWKDLYIKINSYKIKTIFYRVNGNLPTPILEDGLKYTFSGKEVLFGKKYYLNKLSDNQYLPLNCPLIQASFISVYGCK